MHARPVVKAQRQPQMCPTAWREPQTLKRGSEVLGHDKTIFLTLAFKSLSTAPGSRTARWSPGSWPDLLRPRTRSTLSRCYRLPGLDLKTERERRRLEGRTLKRRDLETVLFLISVKRVEPLPGWPFTIILVRVFSVWLLSTSRG